MFGKNSPLVKGAEGVVSWFLLAPRLHNPLYPPPTMEKWYKLVMEMISVKETMERQENVVPPGHVSPDLSLFPASPNHDWLIGPYEPWSLWRIGWEAAPAFPQPAKEALS